MNTLFLVPRNNFKTVKQIGINISNSLCPPGKFLIVSVEKTNNAKLSQIFNTAVKHGHRIMVTDKIG